MKALNVLREIEPYVEQVFDFLEGRFGRLLLSVALIVLATFINRLNRWRLMRQKDEWRNAADVRATWVRRRNAVWLVAVLLIIALWSNQIKAFLFSIAAIAGAMLIVSKELILCLWGALVISLNKGLKIGSTVEVGAYTGQLVNTGFIAFDLAEIGPSKKQTGKLLQLPNSIIFTTPIKNLSAYGAYGIHLIDFHFDRQAQIPEAEKIVLQLANSAGKQWIEEAERHFSALERDNFVDLPKAKAEVFWSSVDEKTLRMTLRLGCPLNKRGQLEKQIIREFWVKYQQVAPQIATQIALSPAINPPSASQSDHN